MRLEFKPPHSKERVYLDIWAADKETVLAIELKYKTRGLEVTVGGEDFHLLDQSAQDLARYDYLKDIQRLERVLSTNRIIAYAIFLTNDSAYWKEPINSQTVDASFRIHQGRNATGELRWGTKPQKVQLTEGKSPSSSEVPTISIGETTLELLKPRMALSNIYLSKSAALKTIQCTVFILQRRGAPAR